MLTSRGDFLWIPGIAATILSAIAFEKSHVIGAMLLAITAVCIILVPTRKLRFEVA